jgi:hypothetical protein
MSDPDRKQKQFTAKDPSAIRLRVNSIQFT